MITEIVVICKITDMQHNGVSWQLTLVPEGAESAYQQVNISVTNDDARLLRVGQKYPITIKPI